MASVESYEALLELMAPGEPIEAAERFHWLRTKVLRFFAWRGERSADELADEVLSRLARKAAEGAVREAGALPRYSLAIARRVLYESLRWQSRRLRDLAALAQLGELVRPDPTTLEEALEQVEKCLATLDQEEQDLLLKYYEGEVGEQIQMRKHLAGRLGIPMNALRLRIFRLRRRVAKCLQRLTSVAESEGVEVERDDR